MAKMFRRILAVVMVLSMCAAYLTLPASAKGNGRPGSNEYEWYVVYVQGVEVASAQGPVGANRWLGITYKATVDIEGTNLTWHIRTNSGSHGNYSGTVDLLDYIQIPEGFSVKNIQIETSSVEGDNSVADQYDNAIIKITIKTLYNEGTGEIIDVPVDPPVNPPVEPVNNTPVLQITKTAGKTSYLAGETVTWTITVKNISEYTAYNVLVTDELTGESWSIEALEPGAEATFTATLANAQAGQLKNVAVVSWDDGDEIPTEEEPEEPKSASDEEVVTVEHEDFTPEITVTKTAQKDTYLAGETVKWNITVKNISAYTAYNVVVTDELTGQSWTIEALAPGAEKTFTAVLENAQPGQLKNVVVVNWNDGDEIPDEKEPEEPKTTGDEEIVTVEPKDYEPVLTVTKTADKDTYLAGETLKWKITVKNISAYTAYNVTVTDDLTGGQWFIDELAPGAEKTFTTTLASGEAGTVRNVVIVSWEDKDDIPDDQEKDEPKTASGDETVTVREPENYEPVLSVIKVADKDTYISGDTVTWTITVKNISDYTAYNVTVTDDLTGEQWFVAELAPGAEASFTATLENAQIGQIENVAVVTWEDKDEVDDDEEEEKIVKDEETVTVEPKDYDPVLEVTKTADQETYISGDTVTWTITVKNVSEYTAYNVTVTDDLTGESWNVEELLPGAEASFTATLENAPFGELENVAVVTWEDGDEIPDEEEPQEIKTVEDEEIVEVQPKDYDPVVTVVKTADQEAYIAGQTVTWTITVKNESEYTAYNVIVTDELTEDEWVIEELLPGEEVSFTAVTENARGGEIENIAVVTWEDRDEIADEEEPEEVREASDDETVTVYIPVPQDPQDPKDPTDEPDPRNDDVPVEDEVEIPDEEVPLADVPQTGDISAVFAIISLLSGCGVLVLNRKKD